MLSIIERPCSEEGCSDIRSGTKYGTSSEQSNQSDSSTTLQAEEGCSDIRSGTKYGTSSEQSNQSDSSTTLQGSKSKTRQTAEVFDQRNGEAAGVASTEDRCEICDAIGHCYIECSYMFSVPKGANVSHLYTIICDLCGWEMENDLICPRCECEVPGCLIPNMDLFDDVLDATEWTSDWVSSSP